MELVSQSFVAHRQSMLSPDTFQQVYVRSDEIARMLSSFRTSLGDEENE
jgi:hypothetical protein